MYIKQFRMTKLYRSLGIFLFFLAIASCSDDDPLPRPIVDFLLDPEIAEVGVPVMFDNLTTNADRYEWDIEGQITEEISPSVIFENPGDVTVTLRAYTQANQVDSLSRTFRVHERILTGYSLNNFPIFNGQEPWDPDESGLGQLPDLMVQFTPNDPNNTSGFVDGIFPDVPTGPIPRGVVPFVLGNELYTVIVFDFDGDFDNILPEDFIPMIGAEFNPLEADTFKFEGGDAGYISVYLESDGAVLDIDFFFELQ